MKPDEAVLYVLLTLADVFLSISCLHFRRHKKKRFLLFIEFWLVKFRDPY